MAKLEDLEKLQTILRYHIALGTYTAKRFYNDKVIDTLLEDNRKLRINEYSMVRKNEIFNTEVIKSVIDITSI